MKINYVIIGLGKSGQAAEALLLKTGVSKNNIFTFDEKNQTANLKQWSEIASIDPGVLVVSPGVPLFNPHIIKLKEKGWVVTSEINLACLHLKNEIIIGITGSVGKSTVTTLIGEALSNEDSFCFVGGNLGIPFSQYALQLLSGSPRARYIVLELSSYQLENSAQLKLDYSVLTYLSSNHLERYSSLEEYYKTKCHISEVTKTKCFLNKNSSDLVSYKKNILCQNELVNFEDSPWKNEISRTALIGLHNKDNVALALAVCKELNVSSKSIEKLLSYKGLPHRLENIGVAYKNNLFINDSKATSMDSVKVAVAASLEITPNQSYLYLLLGGKDKNLPWEDLFSIGQNKKIKFIFFGECGQLAQQKSKLDGPYYKNLSVALEQLKPSLEMNDVVLLSPGGTSLDEFKNFEERGNFFRKVIAENYSSK